MSGVVYLINCDDCPKCYIGETKNRLETRVDQHIASCREPIIKTPSALAFHSKTTGHKFNFELDKIGILQRERYKSRLMVQEAHHIIQNEDRACNLKSDSAHISPVYYNLIIDAKKTA